MKGHDFDGSTLSRSLIGVRHKSVIDAFCIHQPMATPATPSVH